MKQKVSRSVRVVAAKVVSKHVLVPRKAVSPPHTHTPRDTHLIFIDSSALRSCCLGVGGACVTSLFPQVPFIGSRRICLYSVLLFSSIFHHGPPFPQARAPWTQRWTTKLTNGSPISPLFIRELSGPDEIQLWFSPLRRGGKARGSGYLLEHH